MALADPDYIAQKYGAIPATARFGIGPYAYGGGIAPTTLPRPAATGLAYHTYAPAKGGWKVPAGQTLVWVPGKGYTTRPGTAGAKAGGGAGGTPAAPTDPWAKLMTQAMGAIETPAQMEARVNREIDKQVAAQQKVLNDEYAKQRADALASFQAQSLAGQAAAAMNKDLFNAVGGEFNAAAGEISGLAHGLSRGAAGATAGEVSAANRALGALGNAPVAEGGTFGVGGGTQQGVEEYRGGTLAQQMFGTQGEAANFGLAGMIGAQNLQATQEATAALIKTQRDISDSHSKALDSLTSGRLDLYQKYMSDAKDQQIKYITLAQGIQAAQSAGTTKPITKMVNGQLVQWDPTAKKWVAAYGTPKKPTPTKLQTKEFADGIWSWNPVTGKKVELLGQKPPGAPANMTFKDVLMPDGKYHLVGIDPKTGKRVPGADYGVSRLQTPGGTTGTKKTLTPGQLDTMVKGWYEGATSRQNVGTAAQPNWQDVPTGKGQIKYQQAYNNLRAKGYNDIEARSALDIYYKRGERGRPWLAGPARQTLTKAGLRAAPRFHYYDFASEDIKDKNGKVITKKGQATRMIPYLLRAQYEALRKAGQAPPGEWADKPGIGHVFVISAQ